MVQELVFKTPKGNVATDSLSVAKGFGRVHKTILRAIENMECDADFRQRNFVPANYTDAQGKTRPRYIMSKDGFTFLVMGFTGKRAAGFKQGYIEQFNRMESELKALKAPTFTINLAPHVNQQVQRKNSQSVNSHNYRNGGTFATIDYNRKNCLLHTDRLPKQIREEAKLLGMPAKVYSSAKEVLRQTAPEKAACMSFADELVSMTGKSLDEVYPVSSAAELVFKQALRLGFAVPQ